MIYTASKNKTEKLEISFRESLMLNIVIVFMDWLGVSMAMMMTFGNKDYLEIYIIMFDVVVGNHVSLLVQLFKKIVKLKFIDKIANSVRSMNSVSQSQKNAIAESVVCPMNEGESQMKGDTLKPLSPVPPESILKSALSKSKRVVEKGVSFSTVDVSKNFEVTLEDSWPKFNQAISESSCAQLKGFFKSLYNIIDIMVIAIYLTSWIIDQTYPYYISNVGIRVIRGLKILRLIRIIPAIRSLELVVNALLYTMRTAVLDVIVLALMIMFCLGVLGHFMFGTDPSRTPAYNSWSGLGSSFMTIWVYICGDGWLPYQDQLRLSGYTASEAFSILLIYLGNVIISNLFIGVISQNIYEASQTERLAQLAAQKEARLAKRELFFRKQQRDLMQLLQQKTSKNGGFQDIIRNLAGALRHDEIVRVKTLPMDLLWLETFVVTLHYHENTMFRCQQSHFAIAQALAEYVGETLSFFAIALTIAGNSEEYVVSNFRIQEMLSKPYKRYIITRMLAYMIAFWIIWAPTLINRIAEYTIGQPVFILAMINAATTPGQGFIHFLVFLITWYLSPLVRYPDSTPLSDKDSEHQMYQNPYTNYSDTFDNGFDSITVLNTVMNSLPPLEGLPNRRMSIVVHDAGRRSLDQATDRTSLDELDGVSKFRESHRHSVA
ncbi:Cation channel sperm-associated protein 3 [Boothiomyces macroporosus]|uniref:Cation channel sperm-associated protein 3 n=1 Tax=Boothiomyces macroporosus TaxID=261099 RepID=A0AAD5UMX1_9FUNG|nr:Cation channel sperm-associated protein 3 [Boothiomyces macroporosus]